MKALAKYESIESSSMAMYFTMVIKKFLSQFECFELDHGIFYHRRAAG